MRIAKTKSMGGGGNKALVAAHADLISTLPALHRGLLTIAKDQAKGRYHTKIAKLINSAYDATDDAIEALESALYRPELPKRAARKP